MFCNKMRQLPTRSYNAKVDREKGLKNGKENKFKPIIETYREWVIDKDNERKDYFAKKERNFQNEIEAAFSKVVTLRDAINSQSLNPITTEQFTDMTEIQKMNHCDLIDSVKNEIKVIKENETKTKKSMKDSAKHHNVSNTNTNTNVSSEQSQKENKQSTEKQEQE